MCSGLARRPKTAACSRWCRHTRCHRETHSRIDLRCNIRSTAYRPGMPLQATGGDAARLLLRKSMPLRPAKRPDRLSSNGQRYTLRTRSGDKILPGIGYDAPVQRRILIPAAMGLFALSGASSLVFETAWTRLYLDLFGHGIHTTSSVLAAFMGGLGLGALLEGNLKCRRPFRCYALLELSIGIWVLMSPDLVDLADHLAAGDMLGPGLLWFLSCALVLVPAGLMGATLPLLADALISREEQTGRVFGLLYGINSLGAVLGVYGAGGWGILHLGIRGTLLVGCGMNTLAALGALLLDWKDTGASFPEQANTDSTDAILHPLIPWIAAVAGFSAMAYEILWIRIFVFVLESSILSLTLVLAVLLTGLGFGSSLFPLLVGSRSRHLQALVWIEGLLAAGAAVGLGLAAHLDLVLSWISRLQGGGDPLGSLSGRVLVTAAVLFIPSVMMGAVLPALSGGISGCEKTDTPLGRIYAGTALGNILGALAAGFFLVPRFGISTSILVLAGINLGLGLLVLMLFSGLGIRWKTLLAIPLLAALVALPMGRSIFGLSRLFADRKTHARLISVTEGLRGTVTVFDVAPLPILASNRNMESLFSIGSGYRMISVNGVDVAGSSPDLRTTQIMQAVVPFFVHGGGGRILQIGYGSGETAHIVDLFGPEDFDLVEINPEVIEEARRFFPRRQTMAFRAIFADAKNYLRRSRKTYDLILNDSTYPGLEGSSQLYSLEHFQAGWEHLESGGVMSTWLPVDLPPEVFRTVLATFARVFPDCSYWLPLNCWNKHGVLLGRKGGEELTDTGETTELFPRRVRMELAGIGLDDPDGFRASRILNAHEIAEISRGARINSDDHPFLDYPVRGFSVAGEQFWSETLKLLLEYGHPDACISALIRGQRALMAHHPDLALESYRKAGVRCPGYPGPKKLTEDIRLFRAQEAMNHAHESEEQGDAEGALRSMTEAVRLCPFSARAKLELGRLLFNTGRIDSAVTMLKQGLRLARHGGRAWLYLGDAELLLGKYRDAEMEYRNYLDIEGGESTPEIRAALARAIAGQRAHPEGSGKTGGPRAGQE